MIRRPNPLLGHILDESIPLPAIDWETVPPGVRPEDAWNAHDTSVEGWVPVWFPTHPPESGMDYGEFQRAVLFNDNLERILMAMGRWPLWGSSRQKKHAVAFALLQLFCEVGNRCPRV